MQIPIPQLIRIDSALEVISVIPDSRVEIWDSFLSLQIKETTRQSYTKALADFCLKVYPDLSVWGFLYKPSKRGILEINETEPGLIVERWHRDRSSQKTSETHSDHIS
jgi:hypothetical protein